MHKRAVLKFYGSLEQGFHVSLEVGEEGNLHSADQEGTLPPAPELIASLQQWQASFAQIANTRIKDFKIAVQLGAANQIEHCRQQAAILQRQFQAWLASGSFHVIDAQLQWAVTRDDLIRVVLCTPDRRLHLLPWHHWGFIDRYQAEVAFNLPAHQPSETVKPHPQVRILAILGDSTGINVAADLVLLEHLPNAEVLFLVQPARQAINQQLWEQSWDILFFAGHSQTESDCGRIYINADDSLTIEDLKFALKRAIANGLQLAIFNSCEGLGLVYELESLHLPQIIVMRQPVPDRVAQEFLKYLLLALIEGQRFNLAVREARERLQSLEDQYPCASWLPVIFQNPTQPPLTWQDLQSRPERYLRPRSPTPPKLRRRVAVLCSLMIAGLVIGIRTLGWLEPAELWAYDRMLQFPTQAALDSRILVVTVTDQDIQRFSKPLKDEIVVKLLKTLEQYQPKVIGLDIYRDIPLEPGNRELLQYLQQNQQLIAICKIGLPGKYPSIPQPPGLSSTQLGFSDTLMEDADKMVRRYSLLKPVKKAKCPTASSFGLQVVRQYLAHESGKLAMIPPLSAQFGGYQQGLGKAQDADAIDIKRWQVLVNYHPSHQVAEEVSLSQMLDHPTARYIGDRIVLIGYTGSTTKDRHPTPVGEMVGVRIHAHVIHQLLNRAIGNRAFMSTWGGLGEWGWIAGWAGLGMMIARLTLSRRNFILAQGIALGVLLMSCSYGFTQLIWIPFIPASIALAAAVVVGKYLPRLIVRRHNHNRS